MSGKGKRIEKWCGEGEKLGSATTQHAPRGVSVVGRINLKLLERA